MSGAGPFSVDDVRRGRDDASFAMRVGRDGAFFTLRLGRDVDFLRVAGREVLVRATGHGR